MVKIPRGQRERNSAMEVCSDCDPAEKPYECFDEAQHERKLSHDFARSSVRPEALEG